MGDRGSIGHDEYRRGAEADVWSSSSELAGAGFFNEKSEEPERERDEFVTEDLTGFVWVLYRK